MTGRAAIHDAGMVEGCGDEGVGSVANTTILTGPYMVNCFRRRQAGSMTGGAVIQNTIM